MTISSGLSEKVTASRPSPTLEAARALRPLLEKHTERNERAGELAPEVIDAFHKLNLFGIYVPKKLGGLELTPVEGLEIVEALSYADGPSGWVLFATALAIGTGAAYLSKEAVAELFSGARMPVIAGQGIPNGKAVPTEGGYLVSGRWSYGSGLKHSQYLHTGAIVFDGAKPRQTPSGAPEMRIFVVPIDKVQLGDNWDVMGLRATGSIDYALDNLFVPDAFTHVTDTRDASAGDIFRLGILGLAVVGHTGFAMGVGRRLLDEIATLAQERVGKPGLLGESERFREQYATFEAQYRGARAFTMDAWHDIQNTCYSGQNPSTRQITLVRLALNHITNVAADISDFAYRAAGGVALRSSVIQRYFRDIHAGTQHVTISPGLLRECGRELAGLAEGKVWSFLNLVDPA